LERCKFNWKLLKSNFALVIDFSKLVIDYQRVKTKLCYVCFWKSFSILPLWSLPDFFCWILNSSFLESWNQTSLDSWILFLKSFSCILLGFLSWSLLSSKLLESILIQHHEACFYKSWKLCWLSFWRTTLNTCAYERNNGCED